jgi:hypothetical protein
MKTINNFINEKLKIKKNKNKQLDMITYLSDVTTCDVNSECLLSIIEELKKYDSTLENIFIETYINPRSNLVYNISNKYDFVENIEIDTYESDDISDEMSNGYHESLFFENVSNGCIPGTHFKSVTINKWPNFTVNKSSKNATFDFAIDFYAEDNDDNWIAVIFNIGKNENNK